MNVPFSLKEFLDVFERYNNGVYPMQFVLYLLAAIVLFLLWNKTKKSDKIISGILAFLWLWAGIVYHLLFFSVINKAAYLFAGLFVLEGVLLLVTGVIKNKLSFQTQEAPFKAVASCIIGFALIIYPLLSYFSGHVYPRTPTFGLPCPLAIFTFGCFLSAKNHFPFYLLLIPFVWSVIGFTAIVQFGMAEDISLPVSALLSIGLIIFNKKQKSGHLILSK